MDINTKLTFLGLALGAIVLAMLWPAIPIALIASIFLFYLPFTYYYSDPDRARQSQRPAFMYIPKWNYVVIILLTSSQIFYIAGVTQMFRELNTSGVYLIHIILLLIVGPLTAYLYYDHGFSLEFEVLEKRFQLSVMVGTAWVAVWYLIIELINLEYVWLNLMAVVLLAIPLTMVTGLEISYYRRAKVISTAQIKSQQDFQEFQEHSIAPDIDESNNETGEISYLG